MTVRSIVLRKGIEIICTRTDKNRAPGSIIQVVFKRIDRTAVIVKTRYWRSRLLDKIPSTLAKRNVFIIAFYSTNSPIDLDVTSKNRIFQENLSSIILILVKKKLIGSRNFVLKSREMFC